jgi:hypothetical protein
VEIWDWPLRLINGIMYPGYRTVFGAVAVSETPVHVSLVNVRAPDQGKDIFESRCNSV